MITEIVSKPNIEKNVGQGRRKHSYFPMGYPKAQTQRYGEYSVVNAMSVVPDDGPIVVQLPTDLRSYTLKAPLMGTNMRMKQDMFFIPKECILPRTAEYIIKNPKHGDDVPADANSVVYGFKRWVISSIENRIDMIKNDIVDKSYELVNYEDEHYTDNGLIKACTELLIFMEMFLSSGSLLANLEYSMEPFFKWTSEDVEENNKRNFGAFFDYMIRKIYFTSDGYRIENKQVNMNGDLFTTTGEMIAEDKLTLRQLICNARENFAWSIEEGTNVDDLVSDIVGDNFWEMELKFPSDAETPFNYEKLVAYQITCAHFYSNDNIDYIYNAQLWRDNMQSIYMGYIGETSMPTFEMNGITMQYDVMSGNVMQVIMDGTVETAWERDSLEFLANIFAFRRSLRDVDYFTGGRTQPLAVGNVDVAVNNNKVNIIDVTQNIQKQRYLNAVNRAKNGIAGYIKEIFGIEPKADYHNPFWLGHTTDGIGAPETENTASEQYDKELAVTAQFRCSSSTKQFEIHIDRYGVILTTRYFDIPRLYYRGIHRHFFEADRFDMFIPEMQYIGDQPIFADELDSTRNHIDYFAYTGRDRDYKQNVGRACGGFVHNLPGYCYLADHNRGLGLYGAQNIGPNYIRSVQTELDEFYNILNGYSLETYFHFMTITSIIIGASRPMAYNPQILR